MVVKIRWLKYIIGLLFFGYQLVLLHELKSAQQQYHQGIEHIRYVQGELFLLQEQQRQINETYTTTWDQQNKTAEMMFTIGNDICDKRQGLLKRFPNVAHQSPKIQSNPWQ
jgi:hypothetical protein